MRGWPVPLPEARADQAESDAKVHYDQAGKAFSLGEFDHATKEYRAAYQAKPDASFLYNIAPSYRLSTHFQQARRDIPWSVPDVEHVETRNVARIDRIYSTDGKNHVLGAAGGIYALFEIASRPTGALTRAQRFKTDESSEARRIPHH